MPIKLALFSSGSGTNAERIIEHAFRVKTFEIPLILSNNKSAYVHERAKKNGIVPASFLLRIPKTLLEAYLDRTIFTLHSKVHTVHSTNA